MLDLFQALHERELSLRHELRRAIALPIGVLTILGGVLLFLVESHAFKANPVTVVFMLFVIGGGFYFGRAVYNLIQCVIGGWEEGGYWYQRLPNPGDVINYQEELYEYHEDDESAEDEFKAFLLQRMSKATEANRTNNLSKSEFLYQANRAVILSLVCTALAGIPFLIAVIGGN